MRLLNSLHRMALASSLLLGFGVICTPAQSATFIVTSAADTPNDLSGDTCGTNCTLRQAMNAANANPAADEIVFDLTLFASKQTIQLDTTYLPYIAGDVTITGPSTPGAGVTILCSDPINGNPFRVVKGDVLMENLTLTGASTALMVISGETTVRNCTFTGNGEGILNFSYQEFTPGGPRPNRYLFGPVSEYSTVKGENCTFAGNRVAINNMSGLLQLNSCTITDNLGGVNSTDHLIELSNCLVVGNKLQNIWLAPDVPCTLKQDEYSITTGTAQDWGLDPLGLQDNGGPTKTVALIAGSAAIGVGKTSLATDQRGIARPATGSRSVGAFETKTVSNSSQQES